MKYAFISGGTSGIGLATAKLFLKNGISVILNGRYENKFYDISRELDLIIEKNKLHFENSELKYYFIKGDISTASTCKIIMDKVKSITKTLDILINSAGIYVENPITEVDETQYDMIMNLNVKGTFFLCKFAYPLLKLSKNASVVNISSDAGVNGNYFCTAYCASKGAITTFSKALALEWAKYPIRVNCVCPADIDTPLTRKQLYAYDNIDDEIKKMGELYPLGRIGTSDEVAELIYFLASPQASFITGSIYLIDGGLTAN